MEYILMPQLGISEESAILTQWHVKKNDTVTAGQKLFSIETGKSSFDVESEYGGTVLAVLAQEGDEVAVKAPVCAVGSAGEAVPRTPQPAAKLSNTTPQPAAVEPPPFAAHVPAHRDPPPLEPPLRTGELRSVSPRAKNLAAKLGVDPAQASPTGPEGRVIERDVRALAEESAGGLQPQSAYTDKPLSNIRKIIAANMFQSLQNTAQLTHTASFDASRLLACRKRFKTDPQTSGITLGDMVLYAVSRVLPEYPALNAHLSGETLRCFSAVNLAVAVDTERGLMVPVVTNAGALTLAQLSSQVKTLAGQCKSGSVPPDVLTGGSFTVSNLGQYGIESFTPILNAPQTGILGVNTITQRVKVVEGCVGAYPCMTLSLTYDHRAIDGAPASRFLQALCKALEDFAPPLAAEDRKGGFECTI